MILKRLAGLVLWAQPAFAMQVGGQVQVTQQHIVFDENVVELTEPVMRGFMNGLDAELRLLVDYAKHLATYPTPGEHMACRGRLAASPELQQIQMQVLDWPDNPTPEQAQRLSEKMAADMAALLKRQCGGDILTEWPDYRRREHIEELEAKAAAAAGPVSSPIPPSSPPHGPAASDEAQDGDLPQEQGPSPETDRIKQAIKKERAYRYCMAMQEAKEAVREAVSGLTNPDQALQLPGNGNGVYWVYTKEETKAIEPRCDELRPKILVIEILEAKIASCPGGPGCVTITIGEAVPVPKLTLELLSGITIRN